MSETRWIELAPAYVLDALDDDERRAFEERLARDPELRAEVDAYREVAGGLGHAVEPHAPPPELRERVLARAAAEGPPAAAPRLAVEPGGAGKPPARGPARLPWLAAAAGLVVALGLGVLAQRLEDRRGTLARQLESTEAALADLRSDLEERDSLLATVLGADVRTATLGATDRPPSARLFWNTATATLLVTAFDLPPAPEGRVYQLWGIAPGSDPVSLGTFQTDAAGTAVVRRSAPAGADFQIGAVTEEPAGGSPQPTSAPFLVGEWSAAQ